jgi:Protein of unknown function (DUF2721)
MGETEISAIAHVIQLSVAPFFLGTFLGFDASVAVALLFVAAMTSFFFGLLWFLKEIFVATRNLRIGSRRVHGRANTR